MLKAIKYLLYIVLTLMLLIVLVLGALVFFVNPNKFKATITQQVKAITGRELTLKGDLSWQFFPNLGFSANNVALANPPQFQNTQFATASKLEFSMQLLPLLNGKININRIAVSNLNLNLIVNKVNQSNWRDLNQVSNKPQSTPSNTTTSKSTKTSGKSGYFDLQNINISNIAIKHARITLQNQNTGKTLQLLDLNYSGDFSLNPSTTKSQTIAKKIPVTLLRQLRLNGDLDIAAIKANQLTITNLTATLRAANGKLSIAPLNAQFYQGKSAGQLNIDVSGRAPSMTLDESLSQVNAEALFNALRYSNRISGNLQANAALTSSNIEALPNTLNGRTSVLFKNGAIKGVNIKRILDQAIGAITRTPIPNTESNNETKFAELSGTAKISNGIATNDDLKLAADKLTVLGGGQINLVTKQINYNVRAKLVNYGSNPKIDKVQNIMGGSVPLKITGTVSNYQIRPDSEALLKATAQFFLKKEGENLQNVIKNILR